MSIPTSRHTVVVNFNSPELNQLALALTRARALACYVRPYINKGRWWERALDAIPMAGPAYRSTFGRRVLRDRELARLTLEAGVLPDLCAAAIGRMPWIPTLQRHQWTNQLYKSVRESVARSAVRYAHQADCVVAYEGFALPSFEAVRRAGTGSAVLNYPVAHHRYRRRMRLEEIAREPTFALTWPDFDDWPAGHEERLDEEIRLANGVLVGSTYAANSFIAEGVDAGKMMVVPYGVDLTTFTPAPYAVEKSEFKVIFAGQLTQRKGLSYLLRGYRKFARAGTSLTLVGNIVGDSRALEPFAGLFRHVSHQTRPALAQMYREADVFVLPTLVEGMPLVVLEAMACGLPVIVTANGPADIVRDGVDGFIVPTHDEDAICDRLDRLHRDPELRSEMGRRASQRAHEFAWDDYTRKVMTHLTRLSSETSA